MSMLSLTSEFHNGIITATLTVDCNPTHRSLEEGIADEDGSRVLKEEF